MNVSCLSTREGRSIPLRGVEVVGEVLGGHAEVCVRQRYRNDEARPIEAVYTFPLPSDAALVAFKMTCDGRTMVGEVSEREIAFRAYDAAVVAGHGAALLEQERPNVFTASVGNLLPGEETIIEVTYAQRVQADEGSLRWMIPTLVAPRYIPGVPAGDRTGHGRADPTDRVPDADRISPPVANDVPYQLSIDVVFDLGREVRVASPSHGVTVTSEAGHRVRVRFSQREVALDRDVVLTATSDAPSSEPFSTVSAHRPGSGEGFFALTVVPDLSAAARKPGALNVVFVIDTSGSMEGASIEHARAALKLCVRQLREGDRFNVIQFASTHASFMRESVPFTQQTLRRVDAWADALVASGGTEILEPMTEAVALAPDGIVVLLTDGQVGNEDEVLAAVLAHRGRARVYSFGIGTAVSDVLLRGLARETGGAVEFIHPGERIDEKVVSVFARAIAPRVDGVTVRFAGVDVGETAPAEPGALIDGEPWSVCGRYAGAGYGRVEIRGRLDGAAYALDVPLGLPDRAERPAVARSWAAERIRDLEASQLTGRRADAMKSRITQLSIEHGVMSRYTSFLVVEKRTGDRRATGQPETRVVPVNLPAGWNPAVVGAAALTRTGFGVGGAGGAAFAKSKMAAMPSMPSPRMQMPAAPPPPLGGFLGRLTGAPASASKDAPPVPRSPARPSARAVVHAEHDDDLSVMFESESAAHRAPKAEVDAVTAQLMRQLASGLWDEPGAAGDETVRLVRATAKALRTLLEHGVNTANATYGAQVRKAVSALLDALAAVPASDIALRTLALGVAWLVATGARTRGRIETAIRIDPALDALAVALGDESRVRALVVSA